jgi:fructose-1-phosphate kinase PfkB-like protein
VIVTLTLNPSLDRTVELPALTRRRTPRYAGDH